MASTEPLRPARDDGSSLDATFELSPVPVFELVYHHKAGGRGSPRAVNQDYHEGLETLLRRLGALQATIMMIEVNSSIALDLPPDERELKLPFPIRLQPSFDFKEVRLDITRAQKSVARRPDAHPHGGNDQKQILVTFTLRHELSTRTLAEFLVVGRRGD